MHDHDTFYIIRKCSPWLHVDIDNYTINMKIESFFFQWTTSSSAWILYQQYVHSLFCGMLPSNTTDTFS